MNVLILGSYSTGKTTLINKFKETIKTPVIELPDIARLLIERDNIDINSLSKQEMISFQRNVYLEFLNYKDSMQSSDENIYIYDGADILSLTYYSDSISIPFEELSLSQTNDNHLNLLIQNSFKLKDKFDKIIYIPIEFDLVKDSVRQSSDTKRIEIDNRLKYLMNLMNYEYITISGNKQERLNSLLNQIESVNNNLIDKKEIEIFPNQSYILEQISSFGELQIA